MPVWILLLFDIAPLTCRYVIVLSACEPLCKHSPAAFYWVVFPFDHIYFTRACTLSYSNSRAEPKPPLTFEKSQENNMNQEKHWVGASPKGTFRRTWQDYWSWNSNPDSKYDDTEPEVIDFKRNYTQNQQRRQQCWRSGFFFQLWKCVLIYNHIFVAIMCQFAEQKVSDRRRAKLRLDFQTFSEGGACLKADVISL